MEMVNVGALDMLFRFLLAMALFSLATLLDGNLRWLGLLGLLPLMSAVFRYCPVYRVLHLRSCSEQDARQGTAIGGPIAH
jgi:hypothetical protein